MAVTLSNISFNTSTSDTPSWTTLFDLIYPNGAYYFSNVSTSPATLFGNTASQWTQITGRVLRCDSNTNTGGSNTVTLKITNLPPHDHVLRIGWGDNNDSWDTLKADTGAGSKWPASKINYENYIDVPNSDKRLTPKDLNKPFSVLPAYKNCYAWYRNS